MEEFDKWVIYSLTKDIADPEQKRQKTETLESLFKVLGGTVSSTEQFVAQMNSAIDKWKLMEQNVVELIRNGTFEMIEHDLLISKRNVNIPYKNKSETIYPITEAVRRNDPRIVKLLLAECSVDPCVFDKETTCGCGVGASRMISPLAEALLQKNEEIALMIIKYHSDVKKDVGLVSSSSFDGDTEKTPLDLANEWGNKLVLAKLKEKL